MHEVSIALGIREELSRIAREHNAQKVLSVNLKIGRMSGVVIDSLRFAFEAVKRESPLIESAELSIEEIPLKYFCRDCSLVFISEEMRFPRCSRCNSVSLEILSGEEMDIRGVELEEI